MDYPQSVGKILDALYARYANPGVLGIIKARNLTIDFAIEAGCHDGTDTLRILELPGLNHIYAFEPDPVAAEIASARIKRFPNKVSLVRSALSNQIGIMEMILPDGVPGSGSTIFRFKSNSANKSELGDTTFECTTLDLQINEVSNNGLLWLDVEGAPHLVIEGAISTLQKILIAQIEVDMHTTSKIREANYFKVDKLMCTNNFRLHYAPLHPGYFGDVIYIKDNLLSFKEKIRSRILVIGMYILHSKIYPLLKKPK